MTTHPIVREYLNSNETLYRIVVKFYNKNQYLESTFFEVVSDSYNKEVNQDFLMLSIDKAIMKGHPDPNLYLLFIISSILYLALYDQFEKANSLCSIGSSLSFEEIHPMIKAYFVQSQSRLNRFEGNLIKSNKLMNEAMSLVPKKDFRYNVFWVNFAALQAAQGKLKESGKYLSGLQAPTTEIHLLREIQSKIDNCIQTGGYQEGLPLFNELKIGWERIEEGNPHRFTIYQDLFKIISGDFEESSYQVEPSQHFANCLNALSVGKIEEAIKYHQILLKSNWPKAYMSNFVDYLPIHFELCLGKKSMAKFLLQEKIKKGNVLFLDDLFLGRIQLLENDGEGANQTFSRLIENVNRYDAMKRLAFELQFAKEMKLPNVLALMNGRKSVEIITPGKGKLKTTVETFEEDKGVSCLIGNSAIINDVKNLIKKYAKINAPILVTGETGTGKELVAQAIHQEGLNPLEPFLAINCGALTDSLLQSELFGYEEGAFTGAQKQRKGIFEAAGKGTVFLDEFGDISPKLQVSLLRVLEASEIRLIGSTKTRKIDCKIVIATNVDLHQSVAAEKFREDLFFRLARFEIKLPALKERKEDIPELINYFLWLNTRDDSNQKSLTNELLSRLTSYHWPGNIRELKNEIDRLCILNPNVEIFSLEHFDVTHLQEQVGTSKQSRIIISNETFQNESPDNAILGVIQKGFPVEQRHNQLKQLFKQYKKLTRSQIMEITKVGPSTATKDLLALQTAGIITRRSPTKSPRTDYFEYLEK